MTRPVLAAAATAALLLAGGLARADETPTQTSPLATAPLPVEGPGQAVTGAAVTGSAPNAAQQPSPTDNSQAQAGKLLKPGTGAGDTDKASGKDAAKDEAR